VILQPLDEFSLALVRNAPHVKDEDKQSKIRIIKQVAFNHLLPCGALSLRDLRIAIARKINKVKPIVNQEEVDLASATGSRADSCEPAQTRQCVEEAGFSDVGFSGERHLRAGVSQEISLRNRRSDKLCRGNFHRSTEPRKNSGRTFLSCNCCILLVKKKVQFLEHERVFDCNDFCHSSPGGTNAMRIVFMGTPHDAVPSLERIVRSHHAIVAVVTQPDKPSGRGRKVHVSPVKELALGSSIPVHQPEKIKGGDFAKTLGSYAPDVIVVVAYGKILPPDVLQIPKHFCMNVHFSLLPKYRGAAPVQWAIINGERVSGVTIMKMNEELDAGDILVQEEVEILEDDDAISLGQMLSVVGAETLMKVLGELEEKGVVQSAPQDHSQATFAPRLKKEDGLIRWELGCEQIINCIRGLLPWPCAYSALDGCQIRFLRGRPEDLQRAIAGREQKIPAGTVTSLIKGEGFTVRTGDVDLLVTEVQPENRRRMSGADFINGGYVSPGMRFQ
jgi:methionyl-tRNA formyltransferase